VLLTEKGYNSHFVQQEIGYMKSLKKPFIQVIQVGYENQIKGFNYGKDYIQLDPNNTDAALEEIKKDLLNFRNKIIAQNKIKQVQIIAVKKAEAERKKQNENTALGILAGLLVLAIASK
jgi:Ser-tRNA(Ala) deacylase AlaX